MTKSQKEIFKEQILRDYPRLAEIPSVIETMLDLYEADPDKFKKMVKDDVKKENKKKKKVDTKDKGDAVEEYNTDKYSITCISKEVPDGVIVEENQLLWLYKMIRVLELFRGTGSIGRYLKKHPDRYEVVSLDIDPKSNADITIDILEWDYETFPKAFLILYGLPPMCGV